jgi:hypothetical protein
MSTAYFMINLLIEVACHNFFLDKRGATYLMSQPKENRLVLVCVQAAGLEGSCLLFPGPLGRVLSMGSLHLPKSEIKARSSLVVSYNKWAGGRRNAYWEGEVVQQL